MAKYKAHGAVFQYTTDSGTSFTNLNQVVSIGDFAITRETIDTTTHDSAGGFRELVGHLRQVSAFDVVVVFDPADAGHVYCRDLAASTGADDGDLFQVQFADTGSTDWEQKCIVTGWTVSAQSVDGRLEASLSLQPVGAPDFAPSL